MTRSPASAETISEFLSFWLEERPLGAENQKLVDEYYTNFRRLRSKRIRFWYENQVREIEELIRSLDHPRVLEIGLGSGTETLWFAMLGAEVTGIDAFAHCADAARERLDILRPLLDRELHCRIETVPLLDFEDAGGFDIIWMEQAFHHLEPARRGGRQGGQATATEGLPSNFGGQRAQSPVASAAYSLSRLQAHYPCANRSRPPRLRQRARAIGGAPGERACACRHRAAQPALLPVVPVECPVRPFLRAREVTRRPTFPTHLYALQFCRSKAPLSDRGCALARLPPNAVGPNGAAGKVVRTFILANCW